MNKMDLEAEAVPPAGWCCPTTPQFSSGHTKWHRGCGNGHSAPAPLIPGPANAGSFPTDKQVYFLLVWLQMCQVVQLQWRCISQDNWFHCQKWSNSWHVIQWITFLPLPTVILLAVQESLDCLCFGECFVHRFAARQRAALCRCCLARAWAGYSWSRDTDIPHWTQNPHLQQEDLSKPLGFKS